MATSKFRYFLYLYNSGPDEDGRYEIDPIDNSLTYAFEQHNDFKGIVERKLEGEFKIQGAIFDVIADLYINSPNQPELTITGPEGRSNILITRYIDEFADFDYNQKIVKIKLKNDKGVHNSLLNSLEKKYELGPGSLDVKTSDGIYTITNHAFNINSLIDAMFAAFSIQEDYDTSNYNYSTGNIDLNTIRIFSIKYLIPNGVSGTLDGNKESITLKRIFEIMEIMFKEYVHIDFDNAEVKFKTIHDFKTNVLDVTSVTVHQKQKQFDTSKKYIREKIEFNKNNEINADTDYTNIELLYSSGIEELSHDLSEITTNYVINGDYNNDGIFIAHVNNSNDRMLTAFGYISGNSKDNCKLSPANIMNDSYRNDIFTNRANFTIAGNIGLKPTYLAEFIEYPSIQMIIDDITVFHDCLLWEYDSLNDLSIWARVKKQSTELATGITAFESHEFINEIN